jgi:hypothetical protein
MTIASLVVELRADATNLNNTFKDAARQSKTFNDTMKASLNAAKQIGETMAVAGAAVTGALGLMVKQAADYGDALRDASIRTGVTVQSMAGLKLAAEQSGASFDDLQTGLKKLAVNADAATKSGSEQQKMFAAMGITVKDVHTGAMRPMSDILGDVAEHFKNSTDATAEAGEAVKLFGKNGVTLIEFLELGKTGLQEFQERAQRLGLVISNDVADQADKFKDTLNDLSAAQTGASIVIGNALLPKLTEFAVTLTNTIASVSKFAEEHKQLVPIVAEAGAAITLVGGALTGIAFVLPAVVQGFTLMATSMAGPIAAVVILVGQFAYMVKIMGDIESAQQQLRDSNEQTNSLTQKNIEFLKQHGIAYDQVGKSARQVNDETNALVRTYMSVPATSEEVRVAHINKATADLHAAEAAAAHRIELDRQAAAALAAEAEMKKLKDAIDGLVGSVIPSGFETKKLAGAIEELQAKAIPAATVVKDMGQQAADLENKYRAAGMTIPAAQKGVIDSIYLGYEAQKVTTMGNKLLLDQEAENRKDASKLYEHLSITDTDVHLLQMKNREIAEAVWNKAMEDGSKEISEKKQQLDFTETDAHIKYLEAKLKAEEDYANHINGIYSDITGHLRSEALTWGNITDTFFDNWHQGALTMGNVARDAGVKVAGYFFTPLKDQADHFFNQILGDIIDSAFGPLRQKISGFIGEVLNGKDGKSGLAGAIGGLIPSFGGGGNSGPDASGMYANPYSGGGKFNLSKTLEGGAIAGGIAAAVYGITKLVSSIGEGRRTADEFVQNYQNPFGDDLGQIVNAYTAAKQNGSATAQDALDVSDTIAQLSAQFWTAAGKFASQGGTEAKVVSQAHTTLDSLISGFVTGFKAEAANLPIDDHAAAALQAHPELAPYLGQLNQFYAMTEKGLTPDSSGWDHARDWLINLIGFPPQYEHGTPYVPETGLALLHQGERVVPAAENNAGGMGGGMTINVSIAPGAKITEQEAREFAEYIAECVYDNRRGVGDKVARGVKKHWNSDVTSNVAFG